MQLQDCKLFEHNRNVKLRGFLVYPRFFSIIKRTPIRKSKNDPNALGRSKIYYQKPLLVLLIGSLVSSRKILPTKNTKQSSESRKKHFA